MRNSLETRLGIFFALALIAGACDYVLVWRALPHAKAGARTQGPATAAGPNAVA